jgi:hypothetical protein
MKSIIILILLLLMAAHCNASWFSSDDYKDRWQQSQQQLEHQRDVTGQWQFTAAVLAITCVSLLVVGAAIGAKARKAVKHE